MQVSVEHPSRREAAIAGTDARRREAYVHSIDASVLATILSRFALDDAIFVAVLTIIAAPSMKYFARQIPLLSCALIFFVASYVVSFVFIFGWIALRLVGITFANELSGVTAFAGMFVTGWLINRYVARHYAIPTKFPSLGFKVILSTLAGMWVLIGIGYGLGYLLG